MYPMFHRFSSNSMFGFLIKKREQYTEVETMDEEQDTTNDLYHDTADENESKACVHVDNSEIMESLSDLTTIAKDTNTSVQDFRKEEASAKHMVLLFLWKVC